MSLNTLNNPKFLKILLSSLFLTFSALGYAEATPTSVLPSPSPKDLLEKTTTDIINKLNSKRSELKDNPQLINQLVEETLLPHIDFITASKLVMGKYWRRATKQQKLDFIRQFRSLLLRFYSSGLAGYLTDHEIDPDMFVFLPLRAAAGSKQVTVSSELHTPGGKIIMVRYNMHNGHKGWKVYDVSVDGISMITTFRTSFASEIQQKGIDGLITSLSEKNTTLLKQAQSSGK
jgi:phospholipid transport system substrate-binding protein